MVAVDCDGGGVVGLVKDRADDDDAGRRRDRCASPSG